MLFYVKNTDGNYVYVGDQINQKLNDFFTFDRFSIEIQKPSERMIFELINSNSIVNLDDFSPQSEEDVLVTEDGIKKSKGTLYYINKYNLFHSFSTFYNNEGIFNDYAMAVEQNIYLPPFIKQEFMNSFKLLVQAKDYFNFDLHLKKIRLVRVEELKRNPGDPMGCLKIAYDKKTNQVVPIIKLYTEEHKKHIAFHEIQHFNGSKDNLLVNNYTLFINGRFTTVESVEFEDRKLYYDGCTRVFEEGITEILTYNVRNGVTAYPQFQNVINMYTHIFGEELMLKVHYSNDGLSLILNKLLDFGFSFKEIDDICHRLGVLYRFVLYGKNEYYAYLSYQVGEDLLKIYEKVKGTSFQNDHTFLILLDHYIHNKDTTDVEKLIQEQKHDIYSQAYHDSFIRKTMLSTPHLNNDMNLNLSGDCFTITSNINTSTFDTHDDDYITVEKKFSEVNQDDMVNYKQHYLRYGIKNNETIFLSHETVIKNKEHSSNDYNRGL